MKRELYLLVLLIFIGNCAFAQKSSPAKIVLTGYVKDSLSGRNIEYPTIAIFDSSKKLIKAVAGGADGKFIIDAPGEGKYIVSATMLGYSDTKKEIALDGKDSKVDIGTFIMIEGRQLAGVTVTAVKPLIKNEPDKLTYNIDSDPQAASSNVADILRKVPMLSVDGDGNVKLNGEGSYKVLVNGRSSGLLVKNFKEAIKAMPASSIKSIEVITNPPIKYDAEGISGIINIITNRKTNNGYNGNISLGANTLNGYNIGGYFSAQVGKLALSTNIYNGHGRSNENTSFTESYNFLSDQFRHFINSGNFDSKNDYTLYGIEASYEIDSLNLITLEAQGYTGTSTTSSFMTNVYSNTLAQVTRSFNQYKNSEYTYGSGAGSISYQKSFKKPNKILTFSYSLDANPLRQSINSKIKNIESFNDSELNSDNDAYSNEHTFQVDYYDPISKKHQIETGAKYILRQNISDTKVQTRGNETDPWINDPSKVNDLDYDQHVGNFYGGYVFKYNSMTAKGGVRLEYTFNDGLSKNPGGNLEFKNRQFNVVPYVNLMWSLKKGNSVSFSYTQRLNRPGINYLNPYVDNTDPMSISYGNPDLKTVKRNSFSFSYRKSSQRWSLGLNLSSSFTSNNIEQITIVKVNGTRETTYGNIGKNNRYGLGANYSYNFNGKVFVNANFNASYVTIKNDNSTLKNEGVNFNGGINANVEMWKSGSVNFGAYLFGGNVTLQSKSPVIVVTNIGLSQRFLKDKLTLSLYVNDPFTRMMKFTYDAKDPNFTTHSESKMYNRSASFSISWRFGKFNTNVKKAKKTSVDDKMSGSNGQAGASSGGGKM